MTSLLADKSVLKEKIASLPTTTGVYFYKDKKQQILYIGKAANIKKRIKSYFSSQNKLPERITELLLHSWDLDWLVTLDESDALVLEDQLIKKHRPKYNIRLRDDKSYPYIKISSGELYPRISLTREIQDKKAHYFGPYTSAKDAKFIIETLRRHFPLRTSKMKLDGVKTYRPCLNFQMKLCWAPCTGLVDVMKYRKMVLQLTHILRGNATELLQELKIEMQQKAKECSFEEAATLRDQIQTIQKTLKKQLVISKQKVHRDVIAIFRKESQAIIQFLFIRSGVLLGSDFVYLKNADQYSDEELVRTTFSKLYLGKSIIIPKEIILSINCPSRALEKYFAKKQIEIKIITPQRGEKKKLLEMCLENAEKNLQLNFTKEKNTQQILLELQRKLNLNKLPRRIECFDISNIQGKTAVAAMVVMEDSQFVKKDYRKYKIKTVSGIDDVASMREVLERRWRKALEGKQPLPDMTLLDGGKGQLNAVAKLAQEIGISLQETELLAIAKGRSYKLAKTNRGGLDFEYLLKPNQKNPILLPNNSPMLLLLKKIRDETHRFAITFHRQQRDKKTLASPLLAIRGLGPAKRRKLLLQFKNIENIKNASLSDLTNCLNAKDAQSIYNYFQ